MLRTQPTLCLAFGAVAVFGLGHWSARAAHSSSHAPQDMAVAERQFLFEWFDLNQDVVLTPAELPSVIARFLEAGTEGDDAGPRRWNRQEVDRIGRRYFESGPYKRAAINELALLDRDLDGALSRAEIPAERWEDFAGHDLDRDGRILPDELVAGWRKLEDSLSYEVRGEQAILIGNLDSETPTIVRRMLRKHPDLRELVLLNLPGTVDDDANLEACRLIRDAGLNVVVPADGIVASGGVDWVLAGVERRVEEGALVGIHSWAVDFYGFSVEGRDLPPIHPEHRHYLEFYEEMGIPAGLYWRTLTASSSFGMHWMTRKELERYDLVGE